MKLTSRCLGWAAVLMAGIWLWYDYKNQVRKAIAAGWAAIILTAAHIFTVKVQ
jgi:hypothetical protein